MDGKGKVSYRHPGRVSATMLPGGIAQIIPRRNGPKDLVPNDLIFVNCAAGAVEAKFTRSRPFFGSFGPSANILGLLGKSALIASAEDGAVEIELADAATNTILPARKIAVDLPAPAKFVWGKLTNAACVLTISCENKEQVHCAIPLAAFGPIEKAPAPKSPPSKK